MKAMPRNLPASLLLKKNPDRCFGTGLLNFPTTKMDRVTKSVLTAAIVRGEEEQDRYYKRKEHSFSLQLHPGTYAYIYALFLPFSEELQRYSPSQWSRFRSKALDIPV